MILVRDVFRAKFGADEAVPLLKEALGMIQRLGCSHSAPRLLLDLAGPFYTLVIETTHDSLAAYERALTTLVASADWRAWYNKVVPAMEEGRREIFTVVE